MWWGSDRRILEEEEEASEAAGGNGGAVAGSGNDADGSGSKVNQVNGSGLGSVDNATKLVSPAGSFNGSHTGGSKEKVEKQV